MFFSGYLGAAKLENLGIQPPCVSEITFRYFFIRLNVLPDRAAKPPTRPPINAVTSTSRNDEPPSLKSCDTFWERIPLLGMSSHKATIAHSTAMPDRPDKKAMLVFCGISKATKNATTAMLHHSKNLPAINARVAVSKKASKNLIRSGVGKG